MLTIVAQAHTPVRACTYICNCLFICVGDCNLCVQVCVHVHLFMRVCMCVCVITKNDAASANELAKH
jgi:hypothetical protein